VVALPNWEYRKIDLNLQHPRGDELDLLNAAGSQGWELVGMTSNGIAYLKRAIEEHASEQAGSSAESDQGRREASVKYRDPRTNETWSGRGRMANWLKRKKEAGEDVEKYRVA
jgi:DNA-binding protein H-NS